MRHSDDGGTLTLFGSDDEVLIACDQGHYWRIPATGGRVSGGTPSRRSVERLDLEKFGPEVLGAMRED